MSNVPRRARLNRQERRTIQKMVDRLSEMEWQVPTLAKFLADGGDLAAVPNLDRYARLILLPREFETRDGRLSLAVQMWLEAEDTAHRELSVEEERRFLWCIQALVHDETAQAFGDALPPGVRAHIDQYIAGYRDEFAQNPSGS